MSKYFKGLMSTLCMALLGESTQCHTWPTWWLFKTGSIGRTHTHIHMHSTMMMCRHTHTEHTTAGMYTLNTQQTSNSMYVDLHPSVETSFWLVCRKTENGQCPLTLCMNVEGLRSTRRNTVPTGHRDYV